jgi:transglutaminase-like putative cysteine protease
VPFLFFLLALVLVATPTPARAAEKPYAFGAPPAWVVPTTYAPTPATRADGAVVDELLDDQVRVGPPYEHYARRVRSIRAIAGVENAGQVSIELDPTYQRLTLHALRIVRGAESIDARATATLRLLEQENDLDARMYNGRVTLSIVLADLRVGDVTDLEYTITGANPVFAGHVVDAFNLGSPRGARHRRLRLLSPASRQVAWRTLGLPLEPTTRTQGGQREDVWDRRDVPASADEDGVPSWYVTTPFVTVSDFASWGDVVTWALPLFEHPIRPSPALDERVARIAADARSPEERALAALRFLQDEIRYLGMEMGMSSHRPHDPATVLGQRFGDCKDKALLLVTLLRALGVGAHAALVSTDLRSHLDRELPSAGPFDHAIVRIELPGREVWVDATRTHERGPLGDVPLPFERALVVAPGESTPWTIYAPPPSAPTIECLERFTFAGFRANFEVVTTYRGEDATVVRRHHATSSRDKVQKAHLDYYARIYKTIQTAGDLTVEDDIVRNVLVVREPYTITDAMPERALDLLADEIREPLDKVRVTRRSAPFALPYPRKVRHTFEVRGARLGLPDDVAVDTHALRFASHAREAGGVTTLDFELETKVSEVPAASIDAHEKAVESILDATSLTLPLREEKAKGPDESLGVKLGWFAGIAGALALVMAGGSIRAASRRRGWAKKSKASQGETPATAVPVATRAAAEEALARGRCACGAPASGGAAEWTPLRFADRDVLAGRVSCAGCGEPRVRYFAVDP